MSSLHSMLLLVLSPLFFLPLSYEGFEDSCNITPLTAIGEWPQEPVPGEEALLNFSPDLLYLLDSYQNCYLVRGNVPESNDTFCYSELTQAIKEYLVKHGITLQDTFQIRDVSFLNYITESKEIDIEKNWFTDHPETGSFWLNPLFGSLINPLDLPESVRTFIAKHHDIDGLKALMSKLSKELNTSNKQDHVIYIHCLAGKDRTGEVSACYLMQHKNFSYNAAVLLDQKIAKRDLRELSMNAIRWYAFYLRDVQGASWIGSIDGK